MRWFRSKLHSGSRLAMFALAVQLVLSFGHVHLQNLAPATTKSAVPASGTVLLSERAPSHDHGGSLDADCPICALIQLIAASALSAPPVLPLPLHSGSTGLQAPAEMASVCSPHFPFEARAPPSA
jgi:hypothetical protein